MPATSGGAYANAKRCAGDPDESGAPDRRALRAIAESAMAAATAASPNQISTQRSELSGGPEIRAATIAVAPIATPPQPGTVVNAPARAIASRMKRRSASARAWIGSTACAIAAL